jgi:hypothetical protein
MFYFTFTFSKNYLQACFEWYIQPCHYLGTTIKFHQCLFCLKLSKSFNLAKDIFLASSMFKDVFFLLIQHNTTCILTQKHKMSISV